MTRRQEILAAQVQLLYDNSYLGTCVTLVAASVLGALQWGAISKSGILGWWAYMSLVTFARLVLSWRYRRASPGWTDIRKWRTGFAVGAGLTGAGWGGAGILLYPEAQPTNQIFLIFILGGMMLGASSLLAPRPEAFFAFLVPTGLGAAFRLLLHGGETHIAMGLIAIVFTVAILITTGRIFLTVDSSIRLRFENRDLLDEQLRREREEHRVLAELLITSQEAERRRISRDLHDDLQQRLAGLRVSIEIIRRHVPPSLENVQRQLDALDVAASETIESVHSIAMQLHPSRLEQLGLAGALRRVCEDITRRSGIDVAFLCDYPSEALPSRSALCVYRLAQECLNNVVKHSHSPRAEVTLLRDGDAVRLVIEDWGDGFDPGAVSNDGLGIVGMTERVRLENGTIDVRSVHGAGTRVEIAIPAAQAPAVSPNALS